jgi:hypothetical protein
MLRFVHLHVLSLASLVVIAALGNSQLWAQRGKANPFKVGEKVEVYWLGEYYPGVVTKIDGFSGWLDLKFTVNGQEKTHSYPSRNDWVRKIDRPVAKGQAKTSQLAGGASGELPLRTWADTSGKFKIEASYVGLGTGGVQLKKSDGKTIEVPLEKLSKADQAYLEGLAAAGVAGGNENPFEAAPEVRSAPATDREAVWTTAKQIAIQPLSGWSLTPDAGVALPEPAGNKVSVLEGTGFDPRANRGRGADNNFFESPQRILFDRGKGQAIVVFVNAPPGGQREVRLSKCDMKGVKFAGEVAYASEFDPVDVSPSGNLIVCLPPRHGGSDQKMIEVARLEGKGIKTVRRWNMGEWSDWSKQFEQAYFIGEDKILTLTAWGGVAALWDIEKAEALWTLSYTKHTTPGLSPGRKQLALGTEGGIAILDAASGDTLARIETDNWQGGLLAFSSDGKRLGRLSSRQVQVWDLTTGKQTHDVWFPKGMMAKALEFLPGSNFVLVDHRFLVDLYKRIVLWQYDLPPMKGQYVAAAIGGKAWVVGGGTHHAPYQLAAINIPDAAAKSAADVITAEKVLALKPGARVSLSVNLPGTPEEIARATKNLSDQLTANGMIVADGAPLVLEATITDGGNETVTYTRFGFGHFGGGGEAATVNKQVTVLSLKENGTEIWAASGSFGHAPGMVHLKEGQSVQEAVNERQSDPIQFFYGVKLPTYVARHPEGGAYGKGQLKP